MNSYRMVVILLILLAALAYYYFTKLQEKPVEQKPETIVVCGNKQTSGREGYIMMPNSFVPYDHSEYNVYAYNPNSIANPNVGGPDIFDEDQRTCPNENGIRTFDCLYYENVTDGRVTDIIDKDGNKLIQQFVDDFYDGKLPLLDDLLIKHPEIGEKYELSEDNKLMMRSGIDNSLEKVIPGTDLEVGLYLMMVMVLYKLTGKPKPNVVIDLPAVKRADPANIEVPIDESYSE
jgi:hypothetical protein